jgi:hypothetical protein
MKRSLPLALLVAACAPAQDALFTFRNDFTVNLHHFLYVLGRARSGTADSKREAVRHVIEDVEGVDALSKPELQAWDDAISFYRQTLSGKDAVFDGGLVAITQKIAAGDLQGLAPEVRQTLERAGPVYRKVWWQRHERGNRERIEALQALLRVHGGPLAAQLSAYWQEKWPAGGRTVQMAAYSNWAGAYSTDGGLIVMGSRNRETEGPAGMEILFHEAMHQWDEEFGRAIAAAADAVKVPVPRALSHSLIFFTAGYAVARQIPGYPPYADANGLWERGMFSRQRIETEWTPYLEGRRGMDEALQRVLGK